MDNYKIFQEIFGKKNVSKDEESIVVNEWIYATQHEKIVKRKSILGTKKVKEQVWDIQVIVHDPGVRHYPDGSGQPPSDELVDRKFDLNFRDALLEVKKLQAENEIDNTLEYLAEKELNETMEEREKEIKEFATKY